MKHNGTMKLLQHACLAALLVAFLAAALPASALAHAHLSRSAPAASSKVTALPQDVTVWLTQDIEPAFSAIEVRDGAGAQVDKKDSHLDGGNGKILKVSLTPLPAGTYKVLWHVLSVDSHKTDGNFTFTVSP
jgi:methionine-rich copper-binding protein CopC